MRSSSPAHHEQERGKAERAQHHSAEELHGRRRALVAVREHGEERAEHRDRREAARQRGPERGGHRREDEDQQGGERHADRQVAGQEASRGTGRLAACHDRPDAGEDGAHEGEREHERERRALERERRHAEGAERGGETAAPSHPPGRRAVRQAERRERDQAEERAERRARGELGTLLEGEDERHGAGGQREPRQPSADRGSPAASGQRREEDERGRQQELEQRRRRHGLYGLTARRSCPPPRLTRAAGGATLLRAWPYRARPDTVSTKRARPPSAGVSVPSARAPRGFASWPPCGRGLVGLAALRLALALSRLAARPRRPAHALHRVADPGRGRALSGPLRHELPRRVRGAPPASPHPRTRGPRVPRVRPGHPPDRRRRSLERAARSGPWGGLAAAALFALYHLAGGPWLAGQRELLLCGFLVWGAAGVIASTGAPEGARIRRLGGAALALGAGRVGQAPRGRAGSGSRGLGMVGVPRAGADTRARGRRVGAGAAGRGDARVARLDRRPRSVRGHHVRLSDPALQPAGAERPPARARRCATTGRRCWRASRRGPASASPRSRAGGGGRTLGVLAAGLAYGAAHFWVQGRGWEYHFYPLALFATALGGAGLGAADGGGRRVLDGDCSCSRWR